MADGKNILIEVHNLKKYFPVKTGFMKMNHVKAVDDVSFYIEKGETLGLVGESGCGKTTLGRTILRLHEPTEGKIIYKGEDITHVDMLPYRRKMQIIFQDPYASLDPRMTVGDIIGEALDIHKMYSSKAERRDVSIQAQVVNMLEDLQADRGFTYLFIAHDLSVVKHISSRIGVMYLGHMVELAKSNELYRKPLHPYTQTLLSAIPIADPKASRAKQRIILQGDIPSPMNPPSGCTFRTRCPYATEECAQSAPEFKEWEPGHFAACHHLDKIN